MHGEDLLIDDGRNRQTVEAVGERLPQLDVIPPLALVVEPVDPVDRRAFVVPTQDEEVFGILDLVREEKADGFERLLAAVDIVSEEEVVGFWGETAVFEEAQKVVVLPVNITAYLEQLARGPTDGPDPYLYGSLQLQQNRLGDEDFPGLGAEIADLRLQKLDLLSRAATSNLQQSVDD